MNREGELNEYILPTGARKEYNLCVNSSAFEQDLLLLIERYDRNEEGVIEKILDIGHEFVIAQPDVSFGLRPKIGGRDEAIDLMDEHFSYDSDAVMGDKKRVRNFYIPEESIDDYMEKANQLGIDMGELFGRILQVGMYMLIETRENEKYAYKEKGDERFSIPTNIPSQKKEIKKRLTKFYREYDKESQSTDSAQY